MQALEENLNSAYALIIGTYCSKAIQGWVEEHLEYETKIRDDPYLVIEHCEHVDA